MSPSGRLKNMYQRVSMSLALVVLEWFLMFMLFFDASFSYLITKFARLCGLQIPCLLCSRLDDVIGKEKKGFYWDLICYNHKLEISSRVYCHVHKKLVDVQELCETCLFSFATLNKSNAETYRVLVGKLGANPPTGIEKDLVDANCSYDFSETKTCSCCHKQWISKGTIQNQLCATSCDPGANATEHDEHVLLNTEYHMDEMKKTVDESSMSCRTSDLRNIHCDPLSHVEYSKVEITSESESDIPHYDDRASAQIHEMDYFFGSETVHSVANDLSVGNLASPSKPSGLESDALLEAIDSPDSARTTSIDNGLKEFNPQDVNSKFDLPAPSDLISFDEVPPSDGSKLCTTAYDELTSVNRLSSSSVLVAPVEALGEPILVPEADKLGRENAAKSEVISKVETEPLTSIETRLVETSTVTDTGSVMPSSFDLGDAYKLAVGNTRRQLSGKLLEQISMKDSTKLSEDLKMLLSQMSAARGLELPSYDISPRLSGNIDDMRSTDSSLGTGMHLLQRRISLERNESGLSIDGSIVSDIEGENVVDKLKRQIEHDRKLLGALYKELEEERNASAVATNQAMAMITRLQEEKSALHMEALQCLRMMEEQAEYDVEALQKANDLIADKEKEIKNLEAAVELFREKLGNEPLVDILIKPYPDTKEDLMVDNSEST
ncbi:hypothetical protein AgCh_021598 [Apium graveolens]